MCSRTVRYLLKMKKSETHNQLKDTQPQVSLGRFRLKKKSNRKGRGWVFEEGEEEKEKNGGKP